MANVKAKKENSYIRWCIWSALRKSSQTWAENKLGMWHFQKHQCIFAKGSVIDQRIRYQWALHPAT